MPKAKNGNGKYCNFRSGFMYFLRKIIKIEISNNGYMIRWILTLISSKTTHSKIIPYMWNRY